MNWMSYAKPNVFLEHWKRPEFNADVITAMTPKGVEHTDGFGCESDQFQVITAMTPKGVEHSQSVESMATGQQVITAMTPKGVEHPTWQIVVLAVLGGDNRNDAERR
jgi:hypothetical protein